MKEDTQTNYFMAACAMSSECKVCTHVRAFEIMSNVFAGKLSYVEAAKEFSLPVPTVWHCFANHWQVVSEGEETKLRIKQAETTDDFIDLLKGQIKKMLMRLDQANKLPVANYNERAVTSLSAELRALMRDILEFEGKLRTGAFIQLTVVQMQMTKLTGYLLTSLCEADRQKLLHALPELMVVEDVKTVK